MKIWAFAGLSTFSLSISSRSQTITTYCDYINFESSGLQCYAIDSNSIWQTGAPQKSWLSSANSQPNVIITDTVNAYPVLDTSSFIITYVISNSPIITTIGGFYKVDTDTLKDRCLMEISPDNGTTWIDAVNDTAFSNEIVWNGPKPVFTGRSSWQGFGFDPSQLLFMYNVSTGDTVLLRFTFFSDSIQTNKGGIMFDDLNLMFYVNGINESEFTRYSSRAYPSPGSADITISVNKWDNLPFKFIIFNASGEKIYSDHFQKQPITINLDKFPAGMYYYEIVNDSEKAYSAGRFIKK